MQIWAIQSCIHSHLRRGQALDGVVARQAPAARAAVSGWVVLAVSVERVAPARITHLLQHRAGLSGEMALHEHAHALGPHYYIHTVVRT